MDELKSSGKSFEISKWEIWEAFRQVKENQGAAGVDGVSIAGFEDDLKKQPVQDLKSDVVGDLVPSGGACSGDPEAAWRRQFTSTGVVYGEPEQS